MKVFVESLGCRLNQSEAAMIARQLVTAGAQLVEDIAEADVCVINTCAVTATAERKSRRRIGALARGNPTAKIAVIGCYATLAPQRCREIPAVKWVLSNSEKSHTAETVLRTAGHNDVTGVPANSHVDPAPAAPVPRCPHVLSQIPGGRTRAFVKVQDGCDNACTYCITRHLRGVSHSRPLPAVVSEISTLVSEGCKEVVLCGVNLGSYGRDLNLQGGLKTLTKAILDETELPRLRLSSLEPWDVDESFFDLWEDERMCRQIHLPLQAGCDATLRRMGRRITLSEFERLVDAARATSPCMAVTTDIIVGFPGEDETAFRASYEFVAAMDFARVHVFPYSSRPGTAAIHLPDHVPSSIIKTRAAAMRKLAARKEREFWSRFIGEQVTVLWEQRRPDGWYGGLTDNYLRVRTRASEDLHNRLTEARLVGLRNGYLIGKTVFRA